MITLPASVAAGHPATAAAGRDILQQGGSAADAVAGMILAGCVSETLFTGLGGGGFATVYDAATRQVHCLDFFVAVPGLDGTRPAPARDIKVAFGDVEVPYAVGGPSVAVPGTPSGVAALHTRFGRLPWAQIVGPARDLAESGTPFPMQHAVLLPDVAAAMVLGDGIAVYSRPDGSGGRRTLGPGELLHHEGLAQTLEALGHTVQDKGDMQPGAAPDVACANPAVHHLPEMIAWTDALRDAVAGALPDGLPIVMGGDHALALGSVAGAAVQTGSGASITTSHGEIRD